MLSMIYELKEGSPDARKRAEYTIEPKKALVAFIMQDVFKNYNTWEYPEELKGMRESDTIKDHWYYDDYKNRRVISAFPA